MAEQQTADPVPGNQQTATATGQEEGSLLTAGSNPSQGAAPVVEKAPTAEGNPAWMAQLDADLKSDKSLTKFKSISELGKSYRELEGKIGKAIIPPADDAPAEEVAAFLKKMGRPDKPDDYVLDGKLPEGLKSMELDKSFRAWAHDAGLSQKQAATLYAKYNETMTSAIKASEDAAKANYKFAAAQTQEALKAEWGPQYEGNMAAMRRGFQKYATPSITAKFNKTGLGNDPEVIKFFAKIGQEMAEAPFIAGSLASPSTKTAAEVLYPNAK